MSKDVRRVCYVVCYRDPNYTRTEVLLAALDKIQNLEVVVVKNNRHGLLRYIEVPLKLAWARLRFQPNAFIVGFRADEIFWALRPVMGGRPVIFDEFVVTSDWLTNEHHKLRAKGILIRLVDSYMGWVLHRCRYVLTDTSAHAILLEQIYPSVSGKTRPIPVGADESIFYPRSIPANRGRLEVFFYGNMLPLHGLDTILEAIGALAKKKLAIHFTLAGGRDNTRMISKITDFIKNNNLADYVTHYPWIDYKKLPKFIGRADICLGGPFGGTGQAGRVVTGKTYQFLAMGKATVMGKIAEAKEFEDKKNCLVVDQANSQALAGALEWAISNRQQLKSIGQSGRTLFETKFSSPNIAKSLEELLKDL